MARFQHRQARAPKTHLRPFSSHDFPQHLAARDPPFFLSIKHGTSRLSIPSRATQQLLDYVEELLALATRVQCQDDA